MAKTTIFPDSPEKAIRTRARNLPIGKCFVNENWEESKLASVMVSRRHINGNVTIGIYQVDLFCLGVKDSYYRFNMDEQEYYSFQDNEYARIIEIDYNLAHNIIFAGVEFAEEYGFKPCKEFEITKFILEEDDENIPLIEVECGMEEKPVVMREKNDKKAGQISKLLQTAGKGNFIILNEPGDDEDEYHNENENEDEEEDDDDLEFDEALLKDYPDFKETEDWELDDFIAFMNGEKKVPLFQRNEVIDLLLTEYDEKYDYELENTIEYIDYKHIKINRSEDFIEKNSLSPEEEVLFSEITEKWVSDDEKAIEIVEIAKKRFPSQPVFYNLYASFHSEEKFIENMEINYKQFPDHPFTFLCLLYSYVSNDMFEKAEEMLKDRYQLNKIFPSIDCFVESDVIGFYSIMSEYYTRKNDLLKADIYIQLAEDVLDYNPKYSVNQFYESARDIMAFEKLKLIQILIDEKKNSDNKN